MKWEENNNTRPLKLKSIKTKKRGTEQEHDFKRKRKKFILYQKTSTEFIEEKFKVLTLLSRSTHSYI